MNVKLVDESFVRYIFIILYNFGNSSRTFLQVGQISWKAGKLHREGKYKRG